MISRIHAEILANADLRREIVATPPGRNVYLVLIATRWTRADARKLATLLKRDGRGVYAARDGGHPLVYSRPTFADLDAGPDPTIVSSRDRRNQ